ncbi:MAG: hypothetical protein EOO22_05095 [Comamonadaceae bacterium]|nr:MAG: hypothetical protein EOO22_05095 [Comamonadaceae bacterium]
MRANASSIDGGAASEVAILCLWCGESTLSEIEHTAEELARAGLLLTGAMAVLREKFAAALAANTELADPAECHRQLEAAMIALQCEDALTQMLDGLRQRTLSMAGVLRDVVSPQAADPTPFAVAPRLLRAVTALDAHGARPGPVRQMEAIAGPVELF